MKKLLSFAFAMVSATIMVKAQQTCSVDISSTPYPNQSNKFNISITGTFTDTLSISEYVMYYVTEVDMNAAPGTGIVSDTFAFRSPSGMSHSFNFNRTFQNNYYGLNLKMEIIDTANNSINCTAYDVDSILISSTSSCSASFNSASPVAGSLLVNFQNTSSNSSSAISYDAYVWSFGDGTGSTQTNPTHTYSTGGEYYVTLMSIRLDSATLDTLCSSIRTNKVTAGG